MDVWCTSHRGENCRLKVMSTIVFRLPSSGTEAGCHDSHWSRKRWKNGISRLGGVLRLWMLFGHRPEGAREFDFAEFNS